MPRRNGFRRCSRTIVAGEKDSTSTSLPASAARIWSAGDTPPTKNASSSPAASAASASPTRRPMSARGGARFRGRPIAVRAVLAPRRPMPTRRPCRSSSCANGRPAPDHEVQRIGVERGDAAQPIVGLAVELADERQIGGVREQDGDVHIALLQRRHELAPAAIDELDVHVGQHGRQRLRQRGVQHRRLHRQDVEDERAAWRRRAPLRVRSPRCRRAAITPAASIQRARVVIAHDGPTTCRDITVIPSSAPSADSAPFTSTFVPALACGSELRVGQPDRLRTQRRPARAIGVGPGRRRRGSWSAPARWRASASMRRRRPGSGIRRFARRIPREGVVARPCRRCRPAPARASRRAPSVPAGKPLNCSRNAIRSSVSALLSVPGRVAWHGLRDLGERDRSGSPLPSCRQTPSRTAQRRARWRRRRPGSPRGRSCSAARRDSWPRSACAAPYTPSQTVFPAAPTARAAGEDRSEHQAREQRSTALQRQSRTRCGRRYGIWFMAGTSRLSPSLRLAGRGLLDHQRAQPIAIEILRARPETRWLRAGRRPDPGTCPRPGCRARPTASTC